MLYETHKRFGQVAGVASMPIALSTGFADIDSLGGGLLGLGVFATTAYFASLFGAEFPDIDSATSKPSQKHPVLRMIFDTLHIQHRGKFSHDFIVQTILWSVIYMIIGSLSDNFPTAIGHFVISLSQVYVLFTLIGVYSHLIADALTAEGVWFGGIFKVHLMPVFIRKFGIGSWKPFKELFTTASSWNTVNYAIMTALLPVVSLITFISLLEKY